MAQPEVSNRPLPMQVGAITGGDRHHGAHGDRTARSGPPPGGRDRRRARAIGTALVLAIALAAAATIVTIHGQDAARMTIAPFAGPPWSPADAPGHQVIRRWEWATAERTRLSGIAVHDDLVIVQTTPNDRGHDPVVSTIRALDILTGEATWTTQVPMSRPAGPRGLELTPTVHVVGDAGVTTITPTDPVWPRGTSVALTAESGAIAWERDDVLGDVHDLAGTPLAIGEPAIGTLAAQVEEPDPDMQLRVVRDVVDMRTGETVFSTAAELLATDTRWVATTRGAGTSPTTRILTPDGDRVATLASDAQPAVLGDRVVTHDAGEVVVSDEEGRRLWSTADPTTTSMPGAEPSTVLLPLTGDIVLVAALHVPSEPATGPTTTPVDATLTLAHADGTTTPVADPTLLAMAAEGSMVAVQAGGRAMVACTIAPAAMVTSHCPAPVALMELEDDAVTTSPTLGDHVRIGAHLDTHWPLTGVPTIPGLVLGEPNAIALRSWEDLTSIWRVEVDDRRPNSITVATSARGVAVGIVSSPSTVTWLS